MLHAARQPVEYLIRKYNFRWWSKYNFVLSAALDSGTIVSVSRAPCARACAFFVLCSSSHHLILGFHFCFGSRFRFCVSRSRSLSLPLSLRALWQTIFIFFVLNLPKNGTIQLNWWGNSECISDSVPVSERWTNVAD